MTVREACERCLRKRGTRWAWGMVLCVPCERRIAEQDHDHDHAPDGACEVRG